MAIIRSLTRITETLPVSLSMCFEDRALHLLHPNILFIILGNSNLKFNNIDYDYHSIYIVPCWIYITSVIMNIKQLCKNKSIWERKPLMHVSQGVYFHYLSYCIPNAWVCKLEPKISTSRFCVSSPCGQGRTAVLISHEGEVPQ